MDKRRSYAKEYERNRPINEKLFRSMLQRKVPYNITPEDIVVPNVCPICFTEMKVAIGTKGGSIFSPTLDRINPVEGYFKGNIAVICKLCNSKKGNSTPQELRRIADWIESSQ
jgi:hypothetical protein